MIYFLLIVILIIVWNIADKVKDIDDRTKEISAHQTLHDY
jgi:hypothetical protein